MSVSNNETVTLPVDITNLVLQIVVKMLDNELKLYDEDQPIADEIAMKQWYFPGPYGWHIRKWMDLKPAVDKLIAIELMMV